MIVYRILDRENGTFTKKRDLVNDFINKYYISYETLSLLLKYGEINVGALTIYVNINNYKYRHLLKRCLIENTLDYDLITKIEEL